MLQMYLAVSWALIGFIWLVQIVTYPSFRYVGDHEWPTFHKAHRTNITYLAMPLMLLDLALSIWVTYLEWDFIYLVCLLLTLATWLNTFLIAVPLHTILDEKRDPKIIESLIRVNCWRTGLWTVKGLILLWVMR